MLSQTTEISFLDNIHALENLFKHQQNNTALFPSFEFLAILEESGCASKTTGWQPYHLSYTEQNNIIAALPLYLKSHSWGEYVFDWAWAEAYEKYQLAYYPKLVSTTAFTPITSDKFISHFPSSANVNIESIIPTLIDHCEQTNIASFHLLYQPPISPKLLTDFSSQIFERNTVQFHWFNRNYQSFDEFLATFTARKRKNTRKERLSIAAQGITIRRIKGNDITKEELAMFFLTYQLTYVKKGHQPHLNLNFFNSLVKRMGNNLLFVFAKHNNKDVASALFFFDDNNLYGRYWGCVEKFNNLHFELCYYQGIEFCIENNIQCFNPGTQGEHKIKRGFEPVLTHSYHWIQHQGFRPAIAEFCQQEQKQMRYYQKQCRLALPFKNLTNLNKI